MHSSSIIKLSVLTLTPLCIAAPTPVTIHMGAAVQYIRAAQDSPISLVQLGEKRDVPIDLVQVLEGRDGPIKLVQLPKERDGPIDLVQLPKRDGSINLVQPSDGETTKYKSIRSRNFQDGPTNLVKLSKRAEADSLEALEARDNDCGSSPYQNPCSTGTGLSIPAFAVMAITAIAVMMV